MKSENKQYYVDIKAPGQEWERQTGPDMGPKEALRIVGRYISDQPDWRKGHIIRVGVQEVSPAQQKGCLPSILHFLARINANKSNPTDPSNF